MREDDRVARLLTRSLELADDAERKVFVEGMYELIGAIRAIVWALEPELYEGHYQRQPDGPARNLGRPE